METTKKYEKTPCLGRTLRNEKMHDPLGCRDRKNANVQEPEFILITVKCLSTIFGGKMLLNIYLQLYQYLHVLVDLFLEY